MKKRGKDGNYVQAHGAEGGDSINEYALKSSIFVGFNFLWTTGRSPDTRSPEYLPPHTANYMKERTPRSPEKPPPKTEHYMWLSANLRIVHGFFPHLRIPTGTSPGTGDGHHGETGVARGLGEILGPFPLIHRCDPSMQIAIRVQKDETECFYIDK